ncbi:hypothetical protein JQ629_22605 [Bradyrhizobium sp. AUGA SZCCT0222]|nr:hypothetical protein [Bradyrhizobium sp. AUGA SZCCT0222]
MRNHRPPLNDDRSPLLDLMTCTICMQTMKIEKADPDENGNDLIHYRCAICQAVETVRLVRRQPPISQPKRSL